MLTLILVRLTLIQINGFLGVLQKVSTWLQMAKSEEEETKCEKITHKGGRKLSVLFLGFVAL